MTWQMIHQGLINLLIMLIDKITSIKNILVYKKKYICLLLILKNVIERGFVEWLLFDTEAIVVPLTSRTS